MSNSGYGIIVMSDSGSAIIAFALLHTLAYATELKTFLLHLMKILLATIKAHMQKFLPPFYLWLIQIILPIALFVNFSELAVIQSLNFASCQGS